MKLLVTGGRNYTDETTVERVLTEKDPDVVIVGDATGADYLARQWAAKHGVPLMVFPAHWDFYGKSAGPQRNESMLDYGCPDEAVAFPGDKGTADMIKRCKNYGIPVTAVSEREGT
jgi:SLOG family YspA-like protein